MKRSLSNKWDRHKVDENNRNQWVFWGFCMKKNDPPWTSSIVLLRLLTFSQTLSSLTHLLPRFPSALSQPSLIPLWLRRCHPPLNSIITTGTGWQFSLPCCNPLFNKGAGRAGVQRERIQRQHDARDMLRCPSATNTNTPLQVNPSVHRCWIL